MSLNRASLRLASVDFPADVTQTIDREVPGRVVIDPGHGGSATVGGSSPNNATSVSGVKEKEMTPDMGLLIRDALVATHEVAVFLTRDADFNVGIADRAGVAKSERADSFVSMCRGVAQGSVVQHPNGDATPCGPA